MTKKSFHNIASLHGVPRAARTIIRKSFFYCLNGLIKIRIFFALFNYIFERFLPIGAIDIACNYIKLPEKDLTWKIKLVNGKEVITKIHKDKACTWPFAYQWQNPSINALEGVLNTYYGKSAAYIDIGANLGVRSLTALSAGRQVFMFEPNAGINSFNEERCRINGFKDYRIFGSCLSSSEGEAVFFFDNTSYLSSFHQERIMPGNIARSEKVKLTTLDAFSKKYLSQFPEVFIKIDVEGHEMEVIKGGCGLIKEMHPVMLIEINEKGRHILEIFDLMRQFGYSIIAVAKKPKFGFFKLGSNNDLENLPFASDDFLFTKEKGLEELLFSQFPSSSPCP